MTHRCHVPGCGISVPKEMLMCRMHWSMVPSALRDRVWSTYRPGQCDDKNPSEAWHKAADAAIEHVIRMEKGWMALTLYQPWAWAIFEAGKDVENREWSPPKSLVGRRILIHAAKTTYDEDGESYLRERFGLRIPEMLPRGMITGSVMLSDVVRRSDSKWFAGPVGWLLSEPRKYDPPIPCRGAQALWRPPDPVIELVTNAEGRKP